jgi:hypothetical protein
VSKGLQGRVDAAQFRALAGKSSQLPAKLKRELRKEIRRAATPAADDAKSTVLQTPASGGNSGEHTGLRQELADGIKVTLMTGKNAGVAIRSTGAGMDKGKRKLVRAYDKPGGWRHPVYQTGAWVQQLGRQYFGTRIATHKEQVAEAVRTAMKNALDSLK